MIWFFDRDKDLLRLETRFDNATVEFVAVVHYSDGRTLERSSDTIGRLAKSTQDDQTTVRPHAWPPRRGADGQPCLRPPVQSS